MFEFNNSADSLRLYLIIGPGPADVREHLFEMAARYEPPFKRSFKALGKTFSTIFVRNFLSQSSYTEKDQSEIEEDIRKKWQQFLSVDLPELKKALKSEDWLWKLS